MIINKNDDQKYIFNVIGTPIGNIEDLSIRSINALKNSDIILCEDTRVTKKLLSLLNICFSNIKFIKYDNYNENKISNNIIDLIFKNLKISLVSDAGMPCISDPGFSIISECKKYNNIFINVISGPSATLHSLIKSNHNSKFTFLGFLPDKTIKRKNILKELVPFTYICYISPHKLIQTLQDFEYVFNDSCKLYLIKEMTKKFETSWEGSANEILNEFNNQQSIKGEFTLVFTIEKNKKTKINKYDKFSKITKKNMAM